MTEKIHFVERLLDDLDTEAETHPIPASHLEELRRRVAESQACPDEGSTWEETMAEIESEL